METQQISLKGKRRQTNRQKITYLIISHKIAQCICGKYLLRQSKKYMKMKLRLKEE